MQNFAWIGTDCNDVLCEAKLTIGLSLIVILPFVVGGAILVLLVILFRNYFRARKKNDAVLKKRIRHIIVATLFVIASFFIFSVVRAYLYERSAEQNVKNAGFTVYAPPGQNVNSEYLRQSSELTIPHVNITLDTPNGKIRIVEAKIDATTEKLFQPPDKCDIEALYEYLNVWGKAEKSLATINCRLVPQVANGWTIMTPVQADNFSNRAPYAAIKANTIVIFNAYRSSAGEFQGTPAEAEKFVLEFLLTSQPVDIQTLY